MPESGKTTLLDHLERLCPHPLKIGSAASPALLARCLENGPRTLLLDEVDRTLNPKDPTTGEMVPLTEEQTKGLQAQFDTMMEDPATRKAYTAAKVQEEELRIMKKNQVDEQLIAAGSSAIFQAESVEDVEAAVEKALEDPNLSPKPHPACRPSRACRSR